MIRFKIGRNFIVEVTTSSAFVRLPLVGQAFLGRGLSSWDRWSHLRSNGEV